MTKVEKAEKAEKAEKERPEAGEPRGRGAVLILGATSPIARATARELARAGYGLVLAGRPGLDLKRVTSDARIRYGVHVASLAFEAEDTGSHDAFVRHAVELVAGDLAGVVLVFGLTGDPERARADVAHAEEIVRVNYVGAVTVLGHLANYFEARRGGFIVGITSVAGDRGRQSNYVYGSAKGGLSLYLQGLRNRLHSAGVRVITVKPGFIDTRMTFGVAPAKLSADPAVVGKSVRRALEKGRNVVYVPGYWRLIMAVVRAIPESIFKRLKL
jgi:short-subunit dehydrogenase